MTWGAATGASSSPRRRNSVPPVSASISIRSESSEAEANAARAQVEHLVTFKLEDAMESDVSEATVVTLYLLSAQNVQLRARLTTQLKAGARIVSHNFAMGDWEPGHGRHVHECGRPDADAVPVESRWCRATVTKMAAAMVRLKPDTRTAAGSCDAHCSTAGPAAQRTSVCRLQADRLVLCSGGGEFDELADQLRVGTAGLSGRHRKLGAGTEPGLGFTSMTCTRPSAWSRMSTRP